MAQLTPGFRGRDRPSGVALPPGQYEAHDFPVLSAGPTPHVPTEAWELEVVTEHGERRSWTWEEFLALPQEEPTVDIHCVTRWSKFGTAWRGVSLDTLLADVSSTAEYALVGSYGGYTTNVPVADLLGGKAWVVHTYDGAPLAPVHGGPARLIVPHLYFWKSAKWVRSIRLMQQDRRGFWEELGYHDRGDPWREQRYQGD
ncbi:oxidoreductase molybdopterin binding [Beutenbergia cavernae DSM 12333]|uniref:Oxidoreductase molybdopterin binding n=1 Tax=Beutenbergia cavernae (strain ATCC BAA-8 / DSM 12333 / CCUG 43141 / JCM 11478 / NBRC 16432 / NCIMB 13614 / HKI 0122) TaxID=471853 RepID=C5C5X4_BEUC1|nr:sulfite oxidase-like oxidoreductase [Beutenbergia cavernae]ACQ82332.1 oxidoreductase molybdopterin binding [Beutenbergia cavernae DSM 12333]